MLGICGQGQISVVGIDKLDNEALVSAGGGRRRRAHGWQRRLSGRDEGSRGRRAGSQVGRCGERAPMKMCKTWPRRRTPVLLTIMRPTAPAAGSAMSPSSSSAQLVGLGLTMAAGMGNAALADSGSQANHAVLSSSQRKRIKGYLKRCRMNPRHSQLNLEGYLLLPVQRIPRYRLLVSTTICPVHQLSLMTLYGSSRN